MPSFLECKCSTTPQANTGSPMLIFLKADGLESIRQSIELYANIMDGRLCHRPDPVKSDPYSRPSIDLDPYPGIGLDRAHVLSLAMQYCRADIWRAVLGRTRRKWILVSLSMSTTAHLPSECRCGNGSIQADRSTCSSVPACSSLLEVGTEKTSLRNEAVFSILLAR